MAISQNTALFSLLGTFYGGDGKSTFGLPNLQGNVAIAQGQGPGLSDRFIGETSGSQTVTLLQTEMPQHSHTYMADVGDGPAANADASATAMYSNGPTIYSTATSPLTSLSGSALALAGSGQPHNNMMPYLIMNFVIALTGIFPSRA